MAESQLTQVVQRLRHAVLIADAGERSDEQLLSSFISYRDETAFAALVRRHGPMVWGVCRRLLRDRHEAEDAFQATFLVLVRKASALGSRALVANWLYGVAYRTSLRARAVSARRRSREKQVKDMPHVPIAPADVWRDVAPLLDEELQRLPDKYRTPVVLCDLEGRSRKDAAQQLGLPEGTLSGRLTAARRLLAKRLSRRGVSLSGGALATVLSTQSTQAAVPAALPAATAHAAIQVARGAAASAVVPKAAALCEGVIKSMFVNKLLTAASLIAASILFLIVTAFLGRGMAQTAGSADSTAGKSEGAKAKSPAAGKTGRIYFHHRGATIVSVQPDGTDTKDLDLSRPSAKDIQYGLLSARLSPDGTLLAFGKPNRIYQRDGKTEAPALLAEMEDGVEILNLVWSPDNAKLAFNSWDKEHNTRTWIVEVKSKKLQEAKLPRYKFEGKEYAMGIQAWSPDGKSFLLQGNGLHVVKTDGTGLRRIAKDNPGILGGSCSFSPDGKKVSFVIVGKDQSTTLHVADVASGKERAVVDAKNFTDIHACWSPDSRRLAYTVTPLDAEGKREGETSLVLIDADGGNTTTLMTEKHDPGVIHLRLVAWR